MPNIAKDYRLSHHPSTPTSVVVPEDIIQRMFDQSVFDLRTGCLNYVSPTARNPYSDDYPNANWGNKRHTIKLNRLALIVGTDAPCPDLSLLALHGCGNKRCVRFSHLRWGTPAENSADFWSLERIRRAIARGETPSLIVTPRRPAPIPVFCEAA